MFKNFIGKITNEQQPPQQHIVEDEEVDFVEVRPNEEAEIGWEEVDVSPQVTPVKSVPQPQPQQHIVEPVVVQEEVVREVPAQKETVIEQPANVYVEPEPAKEDPVWLARLKANKVPYASSTAGTPYAYSNGMF